MQLATTDAIYSDGYRYEPALLAVDSLKAVLPSIKNVLVLGAGLGSMVRVVRHRGCNPGFTLVEKDKVVLQWAMEFFEADSSALITPVCSDAQDFMAHNTIKYDFIFIDIFDGRTVPAFVTTQQFLEQCRESLSPGCHVAFNYIINHAKEWEKVKTLFASVFPKHEVLSKDINRILVGG